ncbi:MAG: hypothetical protein C4586_08725 [Anaerolineaceae bacterium]|nr:MAG: hypothetical protein C4586_08725 [Anaerolineaceae bacterium]
MKAALKPERLIILSHNTYLLFYGVEGKKIYQRDGDFRKEIEWKFDKKENEYVLTKRHVSMTNCPFCNLEPISKPQFFAKEDTDESFWAIVCLNCEYHGPKGRTEQEAIAKWDARSES